jgi:hypothetical protein
MRLPKAMQEKWKIAGKEELEALRRRNVFKLMTCQMVVKPLVVDGSSMSNQTVVRRPGL